MPEHRIFMVRHGSWVESELTKLGLREMERAGEAIRAYVGDDRRVVVRSSPLPRAVESARAMAREGGFAFDSSKTYNWLGSDVYAKGGYDLPARISELPEVTRADTVLVMHEPDIVKYLETLVGRECRGLVPTGSCWLVAGDGAPMRVV